MILVTGGAGYVGSHAVLRLAEAGHSVVVLDNLSEGHAEAVGDRGELVVADFGDPEAIGKLLRTRNFDAVLHFGARCYVGESVREPEKYWRTNVASTLNLFTALAAAGVEAFVISSSCAVYGEGPGTPLSEDLERRPISPYGRTKAAVEWLLEDLAAARGIRHATLRYFNAAGADPEGRLGEDHRPETHLVPLAILAARGAVDPLTLFGTDYDTPDGTCIRDYVHVTDLAEAHVRAVEHLLGGGDSVTLNLGSGRGHSVREVLMEVESATGRPVPHSEGPRRWGDPALLVAEPGRAREVLSWRPERSSLGEIVSTAAAWFEAHPEGYGR